MNENHHQWPELSFDRLKDTVSTVHLWSQVIGKVRLKQMPWINHSWHVTLYVSPTGLTTGNIPFSRGSFQIDMNFIDHEVVITSSEGKVQTIKLFPRSVASFYHELLQKLHELDIDVKIYAKPNEVEPAIPFEQDQEQRHYNAEEMYNLWQALVQIEKVFTRFRAGFRGKCSPVHLFWGAFDLAVTRFSGREAPRHPGGAPNLSLRVMQEAYSHEVSSAGFWPGNAEFPQPVFYSYCYPTPDDFATQPVQPHQAYFNKDMGEFMLPYDAVQKAANPEETLMQFLTSTYNAAAKTGNWDPALECDLRYLEK
jgi:hypothetical protein